MQPVRSEPHAGLPTRQRTVLLEAGHTADGGRATIEVTVDEPAAVESAMGGAEGGAMGVPISDAGAGTAPPETWVLLPSSLRGPGDLGPVAARLAAAGLRVLRPTPRGMGRSTGTLQGLTLHALASDVATAIDALGDSRPAVLLGHAFGHFVARVVDLDHPQLVRGIVVAAAAARVFPPEVAHSVDVIADSRRPRAERLALLRRAFFAEGSDPLPWLDGWHPSLGSAYRAAGRVPDKSRWWPVSHAPILDLQAAGDPWRPPETRCELKDVLGALVTVRVIEQASHALPFERPDAVARAALEWRRELDRNGLAAGGCGVG